MKISDIKPNVALKTNNRNLQPKNIHNSLSFSGDVIEIDFRNKKAAEKTPEEIQESEYREVSGTNSALKRLSNFFNQIQQKILSNDIEDEIQFILDDAEDIYLEESANLRFSVYKDSRSKDFDFKRVPALRKSEWVFKNPENGNILRKYNLLDGLDLYTVTDHSSPSVLKKAQFKKGKLISYEIYDREEKIKRTYSFSDGSLFRFEEKDMNNPDQRDSSIFYNQLLADPDDFDKSLYMQYDETTGNYDAYKRNPHTNLWEHSCKIMGS